MEKLFLGVLSKFVYRSLICNEKQLDKVVEAIESKILSLEKVDQQEQLTLLTSKPGIGQKTALFLIVVTYGFSKFEKASQLCSYVGITPTIRESGSSVRGRARLSKVGHMMKLTFPYCLDRSNKKSSKNQVVESMELE